MSESNDTSNWPNNEEYFQVEQAALNLARSTFLGLEALEANQQQIFGHWAELCAVVRKTDEVHGMFLQSVSHLVLSACLHLEVLEPGIKLPITTSAMKVVKSNKAKERKSVRLVADERASTSYRPDHLVKNKCNNILHMLELKRTVGSFSKSAMKALGDKMQAAGCPAAASILY